MRPPTVEFDETSASGPVYGSTIIEREDRGTNSGHIPPALFPEPPHLRDQVPPYESFQYHSLPFSPAELEGPTTTQTITVP